MGRIFITGDTHGDLDLRKLTSKRFPTGRTLTSSDYVIITGDVGAVWDGGKTDRYLQSDSRKPGVSWWSRELPSTDEISLARKQLESTPKIDIIITHEAPASWIYRIYNGDVQSAPNPLSAFLDEVYYSYEFGHWYFGHHHMDFDYDKISALYQRVIEVQ